MKTNRLLLHSAVLCFSAVVSSSCLAVTIAVSSDANTAPSTAQRLSSWNARLIGDRGDIVYYEVDAEPATLDVDGYSIHVLEEYDLIRTKNRVIDTRAITPPPQHHQLPPAFG